MIQRGGESVQVVNPTTFNLFFTRARKFNTRGDLCRHFFPLLPESKTNKLKAACRRKAGNVVFTGSRGRGWKCRYTKGGKREIVLEFLII